MQSSRAPRSRAGAMGLGLCTALASWVIVAPLGCGGGGSAIAPPPGDGGGSDGPALTDGGESDGPALTDGGGLACGDCASSDPCTGNGTCDTATHTCVPGAPVSDGTPCMTASVASGECRSGTCTPTTCGDGIVESGEQCDFGASNGVGTGCETDCKFSCPTIGQTTGCVQPIDVCAGVNACAAVTVGGEKGQKCVQGPPLADGTPCPGTTCKAGICKPPTCGNGTLDPGEQCDFGAKNGQGLGCGADCQFDCEKTPSDTCTTGVDPCAAAPKACTTTTTTYGSKTGQTCQAVAPLPVCSQCGAAGGYCAAVPGNQCEPARCGDGCLEPGEQCDDGNTQNLDGCSSTCRFEQIQRADSIAMVFSATSPCGANALGKAIGTVGQGFVSPPLTQSVAQGTANILFDFVGLTDLTGKSQTSGLSLGSLSALPPTYSTGVTGSNGMDVDWWYVMAPSSIVTDAQGHYQPGSSLSATIANKMLSAKGDIDITLGLGSASGSKLHMSTAQLSASIGLSSAPLESMNGAPPGHLASEHLASSVTSFQTSTAGSLCGNVSAQSLASISAPSGLPACGTTILDMIAGGCAASIHGIAATNPDKSDPAATPWGAGAPYTFVVTQVLIPMGSGATANQVTACKDKNGKATTTAAELTTCLGAAAYSSAFTFTTDRVIVHDH